LRIIVEKPWWQNNFLRVATLLLVLGAIYLFLKRRIAIVTRREQQNAALQAKMSELEQTALRSQMNPHFIFNCLTSIQQLIVTGNKNEANEYLVKFARLIRKTLELSRHSFISIEDETNYLQEYVELEQLRIPGQFRFFIEIDPAINKENTEIPNMMLQPVIENSIRHGIKHLENKKGQILVLLEQKAGHILCTVTDNGVGRSAFGRPGESRISETKSYGMSIVTKRLEILSPGNEGRMLEITDLYNADGSAAGTKVILQLPFKIK
jgi:LytS/YehU family sensor histidine kinase